MKFRFPWGELLSTTANNTPADAAALLRQNKTPLDYVQHALHKYPVISPALVLLLSCLVFTYLGEGRFQQPSTSDFAG